METQLLSPSCSGRKSSHPSSPEFEFWMVRNPSLQPHLVSADELFVDGVLLPLHLVAQHSEPDAEPKSEPEHVSSSVAPPESGTVTSSSFSSSKRWKDIFKMGEKKGSGNEDKEKEIKKERKSSNASSGTAELNINIWPFSRSRSAGNSGRPKASTAARKVSSAPCSRSNSGGESKLKKWPGSPARPGLAGVHLGRSSPVWQVRRAGSVAKSSEPEARKSEKAASKDGGNRRTCAAKSGGASAGAVRVLNLNVPMCIGYRQHLSCSSDGNTTVTGDGARNVTNSNGSGNIFNLRTFFSKKVH